MSLHIGDDLKQNEKGKGNQFKETVARKGDDLKVDGAEKGNQVKEAAARKDDDLKEKGCWNSISCSQYTTVGPSIG